MQITPLALIGAGEFEIVADLRSVHVRIEGRVQGVGYRAWTEATAQELDLTGWVRNRHDRSVEAVFRGPRDKVDKMLRMCWRGPLYARVSNVQILSEGGGAHTTFEVLGTE